jgi:rod shape-determining protein MreC
MGMSGLGVDSLPRQLGFGLNRVAGVTLSALFNPIDSALDLALGRTQQSEEIAELKAENARLEAEIAQLRDIAARYVELQQLSRIRTDRPNDEYLEARVRARDASGIYSAVAIDRGSNSGLREGMVAIAPSGALVGRIISVGPNHAWIMLLTDPNVAVSAVVQSSNANGLVSGDFGPKLNFALVPQGTEVKVGDMVVSAGIGGTVPPSLPIGKVSHVGGARQSVFKDVEIEPLVDFSALTTVLIIMNYTPDRMTRP